MKALRRILIFLFLLVLLVVFLWKAFAFVVQPDEQVVITKFGEPVGETITEPGLNWKMPFIHKVNRFDKKILSWDGDVVAMPTKEKTLIYVDTFARWRITDAKVFLENFRELRRARSRIDDILRSATQNTIAKNSLVEVIRTDVERVPEQPDTEEGLAVASTLGSIRQGRGKLREEILELAKPKLADLGLELLDLRFKRINYIDNVEARIHAGMIAERGQIAARFRSEGDGEAAEIVGGMQKELDSIQSGAYREAEEIKGKADAEATRVYAEAYNQSSESVSFYEFLQTMEVYRTALDRDSTVVLGTDSDLFRLLKGIDPKPAAAPAPVPDAPLDRSVFEE